MVQLLRVLGLERSVTTLEIAQLLPHRGPMCLLDSVLHHDADATICRVDPLQSTLFEDAGGALPSWIALEYMAQCAAAHGALALGEGRTPIALLLGARRLEFAAPRIEACRPLEVEARHHGGSRGLLAFDCGLRDPSVSDQRDATLATGRLNVYTLERPGEDEDRALGR